MSLKLSFVHENGSITLFKVNLLTKFEKLFKTYSERQQTKFKYRHERLGICLNSEIVVGEICVDDDVIHGKNENI